MRKLTKLPEPQVLIDNAQTWTQELLAATEGTPEFRKIESRYNNAQIKAALRQETFKKCAYCESHIEAVGYFHIEHIVPKSLAKNLTFQWLNLTLGCPVCNGKKTNVMPTAQNFVHPYNDQPENRIRFVGPFIYATLGDIAAMNFINWLDLNRTELVLSRAEIVKQIIHIYNSARLVPQNIRREFIDLALESFTAPSARHSLVALCVSESLEITFHAELFEQV